MAKDDIGTEQDKVPVDTPTGELTEKPPESDKSTTDNTDKPVDKTESEPKGQPDTEELERLKKLEEAEKAAQAFIGKQSTEIGALKAQIADKDRLLDQAFAPPEPPTTDYEAELQKIVQGVDEGTETAASAAVKIEKLTTERNAAQVDARIDERLSDHDRRQAERDFLERNPQFLELRNNGTLEEIRQTNPDAMGDIGMAYGIWQREQVLAENEALKAQIPEVAAAAVEEGKASVAKLAKGGANAASVLSDEGESVRNVNPNRPKTAQELQDSGLEALRAVREKNT
jgi:hypothetical protein